MSTRTASASSSRLLRRYDGWALVTGASRGIGKGIASAEGAGFMIEPAAVRVAPSSKTGKTTAMSSARTG